MKALVLILFLAIPSLIYCESVIFTKHPLFKECSAIIKKDDQNLKYPLTKQLQK
jgi:hypothetical protein